MTLTVQPLMQTRIAANQINLNQVDNNKQNKSEISMKANMLKGPSTWPYHFIDFVKNQKDVAGLWAAGFGGVLIGVQKMWPDKFQDMYPLTPGFWGIVLIGVGLGFQSLWNHHTRG